MKWLLALVVLSFCSWNVYSQRSRPIQPDGVTSTRERHLIDLSTCDYVRVNGMLRDLNVREGRFEAYLFKQYPHQDGLQFTCEMEVKKR